MDVSKVNLVIEVIENALHDPSGPWNEMFNKAEARTGIGRFRLLLAAVCALAMLLLFGRTSVLLGNAVAFGYPAYATVAQLERPAASGSGVMVKWLSYWLTLAAILVVERPLVFVTRLMPFYHMVKTLFLMWCFAPIKNNGSAFVYAYVIQPYLGGRVETRPSKKRLYD